MIEGIGIDIIEIQRIEAAIQRRGDRFLAKLFTAGERTYCNRYRHSKRRAAAYAARFAAKEAVIKALGSAPASWHEIEIHNDTSGKPFVMLAGTFLKRCPHTKLLISLSHCHDYATAVAVVSR